MQVVNESRVDVEFQFGKEHPIIKETKVSNRVITYIMDKRLEIWKTVSASCASIYDVLEYRIDIINISQFIITNICIIDRLPPGICYIQNTLEVNGERKLCEDPNYGVELGKLSYRERIKVTFAVVVLPESTCRMIRNISTIGYDYLYNILMPPTTSWIDSNPVSTMICRPCAQYESLCEKFCFPRFWLGYTIKFKEAKAKVLDMKVLHGVYGYRIRVIGVVQYIFVYYGVGQRGGRRITYERGFSSLMEVSDGIQYCRCALPPIQVTVNDIQIHQFNRTAIAIMTQIELKL